MKSGNLGGFLPFWLLFGTFQQFLVTLAQYVESLLKEAPQGDFEGKFCTFLDVFCPFGTYRYVLVLLNQTSGCSSIR